MDHSNYADSVPTYFQTSNIYNIRMDPIYRNSSLCQFSLDCPELLNCWHVLPGSILWKFYVDFFLDYYFQMFLIASCTSSSCTTLTFKTRIPTWVLQKPTRNCSISSGSFSPGSVNFGSSFTSFMTKLEFMQKTIKHIRNLLYLYERYIRFHLICKRE